MRFPNLYVATSHSGVTLAPIIGEFAAIEIVVGVEVELLQPFRLKLPTAKPLGSLLRWNKREPSKRATRQGQEASLQRVAYSLTNPPESPHGDQRGVRLDPVEPFFGMPLWTADSIIVKPAVGVSKVDSIAESDHGRGKRASQSHTRPQEPSQFDMHPGRDGPKGIS